MSNITDFRYPNEIAEIRAKMGYKTQEEIDRGAQTPEEYIFFKKAAEMRFGTVWNQPQVGDKVLYQGKAGVITRLFKREEVVDAVKILFEDATSTKAAPYDLERITDEIS